MAKNRLIETSIWQDKWFLNLSKDAKLLFLFLLTSPLTKESGFIEIPDTLLIPYLNSIKDIDKARKELYPKVQFDKQFDLYLIMNFYKKNCKSPMMIKPALNDIERYKNSYLVGLFIKTNNHIEQFNIPYEYPIDSLFIGYNDNERDNERDNSLIIKKEKNFKKPTLEQLKEYIKLNNYTFSEEDFYNYYESNGWKVGKNPMKSWQSACATWHKNNKQYNKNNYTRTQPTLDEVQEYIRLTGGENE